MNTVMLNTVHLDGAPIIKKGSGGGGGVTINNQSKSVDIVENGTTEIMADSGYTGLGKVSVNVNVPSSGGGIKYTGHADAEGLRAIGWTDDDIAYYQEHGVNWNEEDDEYHKVTDDNKALYGVLTANNIADYKERIVYLPKIDTSGVTDMTEMFKECRSLVAIPMLDTSGVTNMSNMFYSCYSLVSIPPLDTSKVTDMNNMFSYCVALEPIPQLNTSNVTNMNQMFCNCYSLVSIPQLDTSKVTDMTRMFRGCFPLISIPLLDTSKVTDMAEMFSNCHSLTSVPPLNTSNVKNMNQMFYSCYSLVSIPPLDTSKVTDMTNLFRLDYSIVSVPQLDMSSVETLSNMFTSCRLLAHANIKNSKKSIYLSYSLLLSKESLLYLINNEAATSAITITLAPYAYERLATDADVVEALNNHPNLSLASAQ